MARLTKEQQHAVVTKLACRRTYAEIRVEMQEEHGVDVNPVQARSYNPECGYYEAGDRWRSIFDVARKAFDTDVASHAISNQGFRIGELMRLYRMAVKAKNLVLAAQLLKQAGEEVGGRLTNKLDVDVNDKRRPDRPMDELRDELNARLAGMPMPEAKPTAH